MNISDKPANQLDHCYTIRALEGATRTSYVGIQVNAAQYRLLESGDKGAEQRLGELVFRIMRTLSEVPVTVMVL